MVRMPNVLVFFQSSELMSTLTLSLELCCGLPVIVLCDSIFTLMYPWVTVDLILQSRSTVTADIERIIY